MPEIIDVLILSLFLSGGPAQAPNAVTRETTTIATVDRIERSSRVLTAHSDGKVVHTLSVGQDLRRSRSRRCRHGPLHRIGGRAGPAECEADGGSGHDRGGAQGRRRK